MKLAVIPSLVTSLILLSSCKREEGQASGEAGQRSGERTRTDSPDQMKSGEIVRSQGPDEESLRAVKQLVESFRGKDWAGLEKLGKRLKEEQGLLRDYSGAEFMALLRKDEWRDGIAFVNGIQDESVRFQLLASMMGRAMTTDSRAALDMLAEFEPAATGGLVINSQPFDFRRMVWFSTGLQTGADWNKRPVDREFLHALADDKFALDQYARGLGSSIGTALGSGEPFDVAKRMEGLPPELQARLAESFADSGSGSTKTDIAAASQIARLLDENGGNEKAYRSLAMGASREVFQEFALNPSSTLTGEKLESYVDGWVSGRPKSSMEWLSSQTERTEILRPAFSSWIEQDSMEASKWMQTQPSGPAKDLYTEQLCGYLLKKGAVEEAESYLATLPAGVRERLEAKQPGQ